METSLAALVQPCLIYGDIGVVGVRRKMDELWKVEVR